MIVYFRIRGLLDPEVGQLVEAVAPDGMFAYINEMKEFARSLNKDLRALIMIKFRALVAEFFEHFGEQRVNAEAFKVAEARRKHTPVLRPFPDRVSIEKEWMIGQSDMIAL